MKNFSNNLRECTISFLNGDEIDIEFQRYVDKFVYYMGAYCAELNCTEGDILFNDERYESVFGLFNNIILKKEFNLELV